MMLRSGYEVKARPCACSMQSWIFRLDILFAPHYLCTERRLHGIVKYIMSGSSLLDAVYAEYTRRAKEGLGGGGRAVQFSDADDAHAFLEKCRNDARKWDVDVPDVSLASVKRVFSEQGWSSQQSFSMPGLRSLLAMLDVDLSATSAPGREVGNMSESTRAAFAELTSRVVFPGDLQDDDKRATAEQSLQLLLRQDSIKCQSCIDEQRRLYMVSPPVNATSVPAAAASLRTREWYYKHLVDVLCDDTLYSHCFSHKFSGDVFVPLIPPQSSGDAQEQRNALQACSRMTPVLMEQLDRNLWSGWQELSTK